MKSYVRPLLGLAAAAVAARAYAPILRNYFMGDDFIHLYQLVNYGLLDSALNPFGGHLCFTRNLVLAGFFEVFGLNPLPYFIGVLLTHAVNTALVFVLADRASGDARLALLAAVLFGVSSVHAEALGWYSVYGHPLGCLCVLLALVVLVPSDPDTGPLKLPQALLVAGLMLAASQSFGTGTGAALATPVIAAVLRPGILRDPRTASVLCAVPLVVLAAAAFQYTRASPINPHLTRDARMWLRFFRDVHLILPMVGQLIGLGTVALLLGPAYVVERYPDAVSAVVLVVAAAGLATVLVGGDGRQRRIVAALLCVLVATCGAIAAGRATMGALFRSEGSLDLVRTSPRYYYQMQAVVAVLLSLGLWGLTRGRLEGRVRGGIALAWTAAALAGWAMHRPTIDHYSPARLDVELARQTITKAVAERPPGSVVCIENRKDRHLIWHWGEEKKSSFPGYAAIFTLLFPSNVVDGRRVFFVSSDPAELAAREHGTRLALLLVPPEQCPPPGAAAPP